MTELPRTIDCGHATVFGTEDTRTSPRLGAADQVLDSSTLLGSRQAIEIEHNGQRYRLQSTKSGKLILTK